MKKTFPLLLFFFLLGHLHLFAQQEPTYALYKHHFNLINPAVTAADGNGYLNLSIRQQWVGLEGAPNTKAFSMGLPHKNKRMGVGLSVVNDEFNVEEQTYVSVDFSYLLPLEKGQLFLGLKTGGNAYRLTVSDAAVFGANGRGNDPSLQDYARFLPNVGAGVYYQSKHGFFSLSIPRLLNTRRHKEEDGVQTTATDRPHIFTSGGFNLPLNRNFSFSPSFLFSYVKAAPLHTTLDANLRFKEQLEMGLQFRTESGWGGSAIVHLNNFDLGYAYNGSSNRSLYNVAASHELILKIRFSKTKTADDTAAANTNSTSTQ